MPQHGRVHPRNFSFFFFFLFLDNSHPLGGKRPTQIKNSQSFRGQISQTTPPAGHLDPCCSSWFQEGLCGPGSTLGPSSLSCYHSTHPPSSKVFATPLRLDCCPENLLPSIPPSNSAHQSLPIGNKYSILGHIFIAASPTTCHRTLAPPGGGGQWRDAGDLAFLSSKDVCVGLAPHQHKHFPQ